MPEPDFDQIASQLLGEPGVIYPVRSMQQVRQEIVEQLRQVWNARGAADLATVQTEAGGTIWPAVLTRALRKLDR